MRSSALLLSLVAAVVATTSAQEAALPRTQRPSPAVQGGVGSFHVKSPRQYAQDQINRPDDETRDITKEREQAHRDRTDALRNHRLERPHLADNSDLSPSSGTGKNGGVSTTKSAVGADAEQGGNSVSSQDGSSASGLGLNTVVSQFVGGASSPAPQPQEHDTYPFQPQDPGYTYRSKQFSQTTTDVVSRERRGIPDIVGHGGNDTSNENSGKDGADGQSIKGSERDGSGPYGGHAHSGNPGSSEGGHVYNDGDNRDDY
ncbi:hypothetical protein C8Q74DRAFT_1371796 [Fomes fomentarius]|nr:hypothetical protein C8Q74DRAFT_1371796 [Fomes fomentarius]